ncbi:MAG: NAD(P)H-dependent oxidoreductase subunit E [Gammaproteobacteria bacterium]
MSDTPATDVVETALSQWPGGASTLLQILIHIQQTLGHVPDAARDRLSERLEVQPSHIDAVVSFYSFLSREPLGNYDIRFSDNIIDRMLGSRELASRLMQKLGVQAGQPDPDGRVMVDYTSCTGMGDQGPAILVNGLAIANVNTEVLKQIFACIDQNLPVNSWPSELFSISDNIQLRDMLLNEVSGNGTAISKLVSNEADIEWIHLTFSGYMESMFTGEIFKIPNYTMRWHYTDGERTSWDLHFVCIGEDGSFYNGSGVMNTVTWEGVNLRAKCK